MTRYGWMVWGLFTAMFFIALVASCVYQGRPFWWWPAWVIPVFLSLGLLTLLRRWEL